MFFYFQAQRVLAVPPIPRGTSYVSLFLCPRGIGGAANTLEDPYMFLCFYTQGILAVRPKSRGASYVSLLVKMSRSCIHLGVMNTLYQMVYVVNHLVCVANEVMKAPTA